VSGKDESLLIVGVGWALSLNTGTIASWCRPIVDRWTDAELKYSFVPHHCPAVN
jgi:hypothetical protein